jgi:hypothetical protein
MERTRSGPHDGPMSRRALAALACGLALATTGCAGGHGALRSASGLPSPNPNPPSGPALRGAPAPPPGNTSTAATPSPKPPSTATSGTSQRRSTAAAKPGRTAITSGGGGPAGRAPAASTTILPTQPATSSTTGAQPPSPAAPSATSQAAAPPSSYQPSFPINAAFYYPWFPEAWKQQGYDPFTNYHPSRGFYDSSDPATIAAHIHDMQWAGMDAGIASWWGQGSRTDGRIGALLQAAATTSFRWSLYYELEGTTDPTVTQIRSDLSYIKAHYTGSPAFLRVGGKPVVFVYAGPNDACGMADRWVQANTVGFYVVLKVFPGFSACASQPNSWHQYAPAKDYDAQSGFSVSISPGFWKKGDTVRLARDMTRWRSDVASYAAATPRFRLVTTFNEWGEGTAVESAQEWASASGEGTYLDALHAALGSTA